MQQQALEPEDYQDPDQRGLVDGVAMSDVMESTVGALSSLAASSMVFRDAIDDLGVRPLLRKLIEESNLEDEAEAAVRSLLTSLEGGLGLSAPHTPLSGSRLSMPLQSPTHAPTVPPRTASLRSGHSVKGKKSGPN